MESRKKIGIIIIIILLAAAITAALLFFFKDDEKKKTEGPKLEQLESSEDEIDFELIDETNSYNETQKEELIGNIQGILDEFTSTMFNFTPESSDYTKRLIGYFGKGKMFKYATKDTVRNIYPEFIGCHMKSQFDSFKMTSLLIRKNKVLPEVSVIGYTNATFENDKTIQGSYAVSSEFVLVQDDGAWKIYSAGFDNVYQKDDFKTKKTAGTDGRVIKMVGTKVMSFDFIDVEGFLNDYRYDGKIKKYDEVRDIDEELDVT